MISRLKKKLYLIAASYFRFWSNFSLKRWKPRVIAVTGSVGKTTMLRMLEIQLGKKAHYSHNANSAFGIAFDIVGLKGVTNSKWRWLYLLVAVPIKSLIYKHQEEFYVVEIDGERPKETQFLANWLRPEVALWVSLGRSHAVFYDQQVKNGLFDNVDQAIAHEFGYLPRNTKKLVIATSGNHLINQQIEDISAEVRMVDIKDLQSYEVWADKTRFSLKAGRVEFSCPMPEEVAVQLLMLEKLVEYLEIDLELNMYQFQPAPGRNNFLPGKKGLKLIDSSYNAHLISMKSILQMMQKMKADHKWLVIGDMTEQGAGEADQHQKLGEELAKVEAERYVLVGRRVGNYTKPALEKAGLGEKTVHFDHASKALDYLKSELSGKETVLFKGSQYLEWIVEKLLADPGDKVKLPRQEPSAVRRRAKWGLK
ncbi:hypothetical protein CR969_00750 [Candidatus Saccharibacteria bacterium]|nr:MAG: hypothetical protein CR969_00750 [Candidatus Saccharibacteria bacterium]